MTFERTRKATFAAGCFWGVEAKFRSVEGVIETAVGFMGGQFVNPTYEDVYTDRTGHAEVVTIDYDPGQVSYKSLLDIFWQAHDPTLLNRQGPDVGTRYRSAVFYHDHEQEAMARASLERLKRTRTYTQPIVTQIVPASTFYRAEDYHQQYFEKRGVAPNLAVSCADLYEM